jgi:hypothetical protein
MLCIIREFYSKTYAVSHKIIINHKMMPNERQLMERDNLGMPSFMIQMNRKHFYYLLNDAFNILHLGANIQFFLVQPTSFLI